MDLTGCQWRLVRQGHRGTGRAPVPAKVRGSILGVFFAIALLAAPQVAQAGEEEQRLIGVLRSDGPVAEKEAACLRLKAVGTAQSVPALAACLANDELTHAARQALESLPGPEAGEALRAALGTSAGLARAGIADSLGMRRQGSAVAELAALLSDADPQVAAAAARSLGRIGVLECVRPLQTALARAPAGARPALADALLRCARALCAGGHQAEAAAICSAIYESRHSETVRLAAYRGLVLASGERAGALLASAIQGEDRAAQRAALQLAGEMPGSEITEALASLAGETRGPIQLALVTALGQRGDAAALPAVLKAAEKGEASVRLAALDALAELGDASAVPLLAERASRRGPEQEAARQALARLRRGDACKTMAELCRTATPVVQTELARALAVRRDPQAIPPLLRQAEAADERVQISAVHALAAVADEAAVPSLVRLLGTSPSATVRDAVDDCCFAVAERLGRGEQVASAILDAMPGARVPGRGSLLRAAARLGGARAMAAVRAGVRDADPQVRGAAIRALADFGGLDAAPDLLTLARQAPTDALRILALRGYWRVVGMAAGRPVETYFRLCEEGLSASQRPEEKRLGLSLLATSPTPAALALATRLRGDKAVQAEADLARYQIAGRLLAGHRNEAEAALRSLVSGATDETVRAGAGALLKSIEEHGGYLVPWLVSGPYRQPGKEAQALFEVVFAPEKPGSDRVNWRPAPSPSDPAMFWQVNLDGVVGGAHCVVYLRTRVYSVSEQAVSLAIGSDDGIKLWVNGEVVHANNAVRGLVPGQDKAQARLRSGWNDLLAKVTQHTAGCGLCVRIARVDGSPIPALRCDPDGREERLRDRP